MACGEIDPELERAVDEAFNEAFWGPAPTREQVLAVLERNETRIREHVADVLRECYIADRAAYLLDIPIAELWRRIKEEEVIALSFDSYNWLPKWQFTESEDGTLTVHPKLLEAKKVWGKLQEFSFCSMMLGEQRGYSQSRLEILLDGTDESAVANVMITLRDHGISPM